MALIVQSTTNSGQHQATRGAIWPVYVINMADNTARLAACDAALSAQGIAFQRFEAVNGRDLPEGDLAKVYDPAANQHKARHPLIGGEIGCYLSHIGLWKRIVASDAPGAIILEDDFAASDDLAVVLAAVSADQGGWDMVKLFSRRPSARMIERRPLDDRHDLARPYQIPNTTLGYALRREAAQRLLQGALPIARPIDEDHKRFWEHGLSVWMVQPPPLSFGVEASGDGTIQAARKASGQGRAPLGGIKQGWINLRYRIGYLFHLHKSRLLGPRRGNKSPGPP